MKTAKERCMRSKTMGCALVILLFAGSLAASDEFETYKVLATQRTSTMEKEMNESAASGFRFEATMGGESAFGGKEVLVVMSKPRSENGAGRFSYRLLATNKTGTMQKELQLAGNEGYAYRGQTVFISAYGGKEVVVILERDNERGSRRRFEYKLLATNKTSTMQKELQQAADAGFLFDGLTIGETAFGGKEVVCILRKEVTP
jgi:hypothetical protein